MEGKPEEIYPKVGIGVMVMKDGKVLLGKRKGSHGEGEYAWPGGHFEYMEFFEGCAKREVKEEIGMEITNIRFVRLLNLKKYPPKHYVDIGLMADWQSGEPQVMEPEKCEGWGWYDMDDLPSPRFSTVIHTLRHIKPAGIIGTLKMARANKYSYERTRATL